MPKSDTATVALWLARAALARHFLRPSDCSLAGLLWGKEIHGRRTDPSSIGRRRFMTSKVRGSLSKRPPCLPDSGAQEVPVRPTTARAVQPGLNYELVRRYEPAIRVAARVQLSERSR